jgi:hypothetical protein
VSEKHHKDFGLDAKDWVNAAMACMGGKGGGKNALTATGQAKTTEHLDQAIRDANTFILAKKTQHPAV